MIDRERLSTRLYNYLAVLWDGDIDANDHVRIADWLDNLDDADILGKDILTLGAEYELQNYL